MLSNAALQWVPGHRELLPRWLAALRPGAWFALQVPGNFNSPSHTLMRGLAGSEAWAGRLAGVLRHDDAAGRRAEYLQIMLDAGCDADAWETTYYQLLHGHRPRAGVGRGTALRPVLAALSAAEAREFEAEYSARLAEAYPAGPHGTVFPVPADLCCGPETGLSRCSQCHRDPPGGGDYNDGAAWGGRHSDPGSGPDLAMEVRC